MKKITYEDKIALRVNPNVPDKNKIRHADMNEIKEVVNDIVDKVDASSGVPIGTVLFWPVENNIPNGFMECDDRRLPKADYPKAGSILKEDENDNTKFKLPDYRGQTLVSRGGNEFQIVGSSTGSETHQLTVGEMPSHKHELNRGLTPGGNASGYTWSNTDFTSTEGIYAAGGVCPQ